jgi:DNA-binding YbaB/EbfC family protein
MTDTLSVHSTAIEEAAVRPGGQPNMQQIMKQAQKMQQQMEQAQAELAEAEVTGTAGSGLVTVTVNGTGDVQYIKIDPSLIDPDDIETLEDLIVLAIREASDNARALAEQKMGPLTAGLGGLGLPGLPGF